MDRKKAVRQEQEHIRAWYLQESGGIKPREVIDLRNGGREVLWWLEPPLDHCDNPILVESFVDGYSLRTERMVRKIIA